MIIIGGIVIVWALVAVCVFVGLHIAAHPRVADRPLREIHAEACCAHCLATNHRVEGQRYGDFWQWRCESCGRCQLDLDPVPF